MLGMEGIGAGGSCFAFILCDWEVVVGTAVTSPPALFVLPG